MGLWTGFVELIQSVLFAATQACGGNLAMGIIAAALGLRLALLPLTYKMARESHRRSRIMNRIRPELARLQKAYQRDIAGFAAAQAALFKRNGIKLIDGRSLMGAAIQMPFVLAMYTAVRNAISVASPTRFLWIPNIARPDAVLAVLVSLLTFGVMMTVPQISQHSSKFLMAIPAVITLVVLLKFSAGLGLYWGASSAVGVLQGVVLRRARVSD